MYVGPPVEYKAVICDRLGHRYGTAQRLARINKEMPSVVLVENKCVECGLLHVEVIPLAQPLD